MLVKQLSRVILLHFCTTESCIAKSFPVTISVCYWDWCHVCTDSLESPTTPRLQQNYQRNRGCGWSETHHFLWMCFVRWSLWHYFDIICVERRGRVGRMSVLWSLIWCNNKYLDTGTIWSTSDTHPPPSRDNIVLSLSLQYWKLYFDIDGENLRARAQIWNTEFKTRKQ